MSNGSPTAYLLWAILSSVYLVFLLLHLWYYDRFACLRWDAGRQPGAFKRIMTYSYLGTVPLLVVFSVAITALKFREGFFIGPDGTITPLPFSQWSYSSRRWVLPLDFILSVAWSLEHVTHLEELTFWVFLLTQGPGKREWFNSWEFRLWIFGSIFTLAGMPITVLTTRFNIDTCLAYIFLVGSSVGTTTTLCFLYVLARFPWFITYVKAEGAEPDVVVRLATFYQLNRIRVAFRFLFTLPLMVIAIDALHKGDHHPIISDPFAFDFLLMMGAIGCTVSSAITLLIFFPRSIARESGYKTKAASYSPSRSRSIGVTRINSNHLPMYQYHDQDQQYNYHYHRTPEPKPYTPDPLHPDEDEDGGDREFYVYPETDDGEGEEFEGSLVSPTSLQSALTSGESGYDPDASPVPRIHVRLYGEQGQGEGEGSVLAAVSSDDTVWERGAGAGAGAGGGSERRLSVYSQPPTPTRANMGWGRQAQMHGSGEQQRRRSLSFTEVGAQNASGEPMTPSETRPTTRDGDAERDATQPEPAEQQPPAQLQLQSPPPPSPRAHRQRESHRVSSGKRRRHHSGGPFFFDRGGRLVGPTHAGAGAIREEDLGEGGRGGEEEEGGDHGAILRRVLERRRARARERERRERWVEESVLHPYVIHWTSPIDLHDGVSRGRGWGERGRRRRQEAGLQLV